MFKFVGCRQNALIKKILRHIKQPGYESQQQHEKNILIQEAKRVLKRLQVPQLETLLTSLETVGGASGPSCVLVQKSALKRVLGSSGEPSLLTCKVFRWPDVTDLSGLRRGPDCSLVSHSTAARGDVSLQCCNPFHYSRICQPGRGHIFLHFSCTSL